jgi:hypothetical protein
LWNILDPGERSFETAIAALEVLRIPRDAQQGHIRRVIDLEVGAILASGKSG